MIQGSLDSLLDSVKNLVKNEVSKLTDLLKPDLFLDKLYKTSYEPPFIELTVGNIPIDIHNQFKSMNIQKIPGGVFKFELELYDGTFMLEKLLLSYMVPITIKYGTPLNFVTYKGTIMNSKSTVKLSEGVTISSTGILSSSMVNDNKPREFPVEKYKGSVFAILTDLTKELNMSLVIRDDIKDKILTDDEGNPKSLLSGTNQTDIELIKYLVEYLGDETTFSILPAEVLSTDTRERLMIFKMNNSFTESSTIRNLLIADLNHRNSIVESYDFSIKQMQFSQYGGTEKYVSVDPMTNEVLESDSDVSNRAHNEFTTDLYNGAGKVVRYLTTSSSNKTDMDERIQRRATQKINASYEVTLELARATPDVLPFVTELEINSYISSPANLTGARKHHTSGRYTIREVVDHLGNGRFTQTITAYRCGGARLEDLVG